MKTEIGFLFALLFATAAYAEHTNQLADIKKTPAPVHTVRTPARTNAPPSRATNSSPRIAEIYRPKYELIRMTTNALAERHAIIGWEIRRKKNH